jgi:DNA-binding transcriptional MerR regulator
MFRIGEFSHIGRVSTRLLRYYDKLGLLAPGFVDPQTGYRYYTADQLPRLNRILALKEMGMRLDEIESLIDAEVPADQLRGMLTMKASDLAREIETQQMRMRLIESRINQIDSADDDIDLLTKHVAAQPFLSVHTRFDSTSDGPAFVGQMLEAAAPFAHDLRVLAAWHGEFSDEDLDVEIGFLGGLITDELRIDDRRTLTPRMLPAVDVVSTVRVGNPDVTHGVYGTVGRWLTANDAKIAGPVRELIMQWPAPGVEPVVEVQFPIA